jgi:hypothetical protein
VATGVKAVRIIPGTGSAVVERLIDRLKQHHRIETRYETRAANSRVVTAIRLWQ